MRVLPLLPLLLAASPAVAQDPPSDADMARRADRVADFIENPRNADAIASAMGGLTEALMQLRVGGLIEAVRRVSPRADERLPRVDPNATLAEMSGSDPELPARMAEGARASTAVAGVAIREMGRMAPVLAAMTRDLAAQMEQRVARVASERRGD